MKQKAGVRTLASLPYRKADFVEPMDCAPVTKLPDGPEWIYEARWLPRCWCQIGSWCNAVFSAAQVLQPLLSTHCRRPWRASRRHSGRWRNRRARQIRQPKLQSAPKLDAPCIAEEALLYL